VGGENSGKALEKKMTAVERGQRRRYVHPRERLGLFFENLM
jgi:hypothetical protein